MSSAAGDTEGKETGRKALAEARALMESALKIFSDPLRGIDSLYASGFRHSISDIITRIDTQTEAALVTEQKLALERQKAALDKKKAAEDLAIRVAEVRAAMAEIAKQKSAQNK